MSDVYFGKGGKSHPNKKRQILQGDQKRNQNMIRNYELYSVLKLNLISVGNFCINRLYFKRNTGILATFLTFSVLTVQVQP